MTAETDRPASLQFVVVRACRLNADGSKGNLVSTTPNGMMTTDTQIKLDMKPATEAGDDIVIKNGMGGIIAAFKDVDRFKRLDLALTLAAPDPEFAELLTNGTMAVLAAAGSTVGAAYPAVGAAMGGLGVGIEGWSKAYTGGVQATTNPYFRWVLPRCYFWPADTSLEDAGMQRVFNGIGIENSNFSKGPANDFPTGVTAVRAAQWFRDTTANLPAAVTGYQILPIQT